MYLHRKIMQDYLKRPLKSTEIIHHIDHDGTNNVLSNLYLFENKRQHTRCHVFAEQIALSLLEKLVWFDRKNKKYICKNNQESSEQKYSKKFIKRYDDFWKWMKNNNIKVYYRKVVGKYISNIYGICRNMKQGGTRTTLHYTLMEYVLGRKLYHDEIVHHIDGNPQNNNLNNLIVMNRKDHAQCRRYLSNCVGELYKNNIVGFKDGVYFVNKD